ncbi:MAG: mechanosensitive ion channel family protein [Planctomycetota bacterium]|jgi:small conductance mechanosensitive channel
MEDILDAIYEYGLKVIGAIVIFIVGRWVAKLLSGLVEKALAKANVDKTLTKFANSLCYIALLIFVIIAAVGTLGVPIIQFSVVIGAAGLAIGLALQGSLANFASGVLMLIFKPFKVGDFVEVAGAKGTVKQVQIFNTILAAPDNVRVIIPNAQVTGGNILNYSVNGTRRVDLVVGVSYKDDLKKAKEVIEQVLAGDDRVLKDPPFTVAVSELGDSSVNFVVRPWVKAEDYWDVYFDVTAKVKLNLDQNGISIPYPQRDIHMINSSN